MMAWFTSAEIRILREICLLQLKDDDDGDPWFEMIPPVICPSSNIAGLASNGDNSGRAGWTRIEPNPVPASVVYDAWQRFAQQGFETSSGRPEAVA
jgi:hypothetical protein